MVAWFLFPGLIWISICIPLLKFIKFERSSLPSKIFGHAPNWSIGVSRKAGWNAFIYIHYSPKEEHIDFTQFARWPRVTDPDHGSCGVCLRSNIKRPHSKSPYERTILSFDTGSVASSSQDHLTQLKWPEVKADDLETSENRDHFHVQDIPLWVSGITSRHKFHTSRCANFAIPIL